MIRRSIAVKTLRLRIDVGKSAYHHLSQSAALQGSSGRKALPLDTRSNSLEFEEPINVKETSSGYSFTGPGGLIAQIRTVGIKYNSKRA